MRRVRIGIENVDIDAVRYGSLSRLFADFIEAGYGADLQEWARRNPDEYAQTLTVLAQLAGFPIDLSECKPEFRTTGRLGLNGEGNKRRKGRTGRRGGRMRGGWQRQ